MVTAFAILAMFFNEASKPGDNIDWRVTIRVKDAEKGEKVEESFCATNV